MLPPVVKRSSSSAWWSGTFMVLSGDVVTVVSGADDMIAGASCYVILYKVAQIILRNIHNKAQKHDGVYEFIYCYS